MAIGTLAGAGTFGFRIQPWIILIVHGAATERSIARLFLAGVLPGLMLAVIVSGCIMIRAALNRHRMPALAPPATWAGKGRAAARLLPTVGLCVAVIGAIHGGLTWRTGAAVAGAAGATGALGRARLVESLRGTAISPRMIAFILLGAAFPRVAMGFTGIPRASAAWIGDRGYSQFGRLTALLVFLIVAGVFPCGIFIVGLATSVILPMGLAAGIDAIRFGVVPVEVVETRQIPPLGLQPVRVAVQHRARHLPRRAAVLSDACPGHRPAGPFPEIALWLPGTMLSR